MQKELIVIGRYKNTDPYWKSVVSNNPVTLDLLLVEEHERVHRDTLETNLTVTYKINDVLNVSPIFPTPGYLPKRNEKLCSYRSLYQFWVLFVCLFLSFFLQLLKTVNSSYVLQLVNGWTECVRSYSGMLLSNKVNKLLVCE